jgi:hypothetical protein
MADPSVINKLYTGCAGFVYNTHSIRWFTKQFEKIERWRLKMPKDTPIPTHIFSIIKKDNQLYAAEAVFNEFRIWPLEKYYPLTIFAELEFYEPKILFTQNEQELFEKCIDEIHATTKGYDVVGYLAQMLHTVFGINLKAGKGTKYVYCNEAHEYAYNAARPGSFPHPWNDNPLELQQSTLLKKMT